MTTTRGATPPTKTTQNGHQVPPPRRSAKTPARAPAQAQASGPTPKKPSPLDIIGLREAGGALRFLGQAVMRHPRAVLRTVPDLGEDLVKISLGRSQVAPEKGDKRFADPAWQQNPLFRATMQSYLTWGAGMERYLDNLDLEGMAVERTRFGMVLLREAMAPTNFFATNPAAVKRCYGTGGGSLRRGLANWAGDMVHNHGMPSMVDRRPFTIGENIAATPGSVIFRNEVFELIQYTPQTKMVYDRPLLVVPPQVNKYYALDLAPGRSMYEYLLKQGIQVYGISWRNPTRAQRDWNFDTYVQATIDAIDVVREVSGSPDVNIMGGCLGGMTAALAQAHLAAQRGSPDPLGHDDRHAARLRLRRADVPVHHPAAARAGQAGVPARRRDQRLAARVDVRLAAPERPGRNYWVNNYLLGQDPPAFDILAWNADTTRLTTAFHRQLMDMVGENQMVHPGGMTVLGTPVDLSRIAATRTWRPG